jgi:hypothetical protein
VIVNGNSLNDVAAGAGVLAQLETAGFVCDGELIKSKNSHKQRERKSGS